MNEEDKKELDAFRASKASLEALEAAKATAKVIAGCKYKKDTKEGKDTGLRYIVFPTPIFTNADISASKLTFFKSWASSAYAYRHDGGALVPVTIKLTITSKKNEPARLAGIPSNTGGTTIKEG